MYKKELKLSGLPLFLEKPLFVIDFWWISTALKTAIFSPEGAIDSCSLIICSVTKFCHFIGILNFLSIDVLSETFMNLCNMIFEDERFCRCGWGLDWFVCKHSVINVASIVLLEWNISKEGILYKEDISVRGINKL